MCKASALTPTPPSAMPPLQYHSLPQLCLGAICSKAQGSLLGVLRGAYSVLRIKPRVSHVQCQCLKPAPSSGLGYNHPLRGIEVTIPPPLCRLLLFGSWHAELAPDTPRTCGDARDPGHAWHNAYTRREGAPGGTLSGRHTPPPRLPSTSPHCALISEVSRWLQSRRWRR